MGESRSDALLFFGATGDLAFKKIFPALHAMAKRGNLRVPVIGVARSAENIEEFRARARSSLEKHGGGDLPHRPLPGKAAGSERAVLQIRQFPSRTVLESQLCRKRTDHHGGEF